MPRGHILPTEDLDYSRLLVRLQEEWAHPDPAAAEPVIIETTNKSRPQ